MRILVCVKQVPELPDEPRPRADGRGYDAAGRPRRMNPYDEPALEEALRLRDARGAVEVTAVSAGPPEVVETLRRALAVGADRAVWVDSAAGLQGEARVVAAQLAEYARGERFDLILAGAMSADLMRGEVAPMLAALLDLPHATAAIAAEPAADGASVVVERELSGGERARVRLPLPALVTVSSGINQLRYPSLSHTLRARRADVPRFAPVAPAEPARPTEVFVPPPPAAIQWITGDVETMAAKLLAAIHARTGLV